MAVPAHKTEYFIIENSNLQKKANTAGLLKSEHFQPSHTNSVHSETFPRKIMHRFRLFLGQKRCIVFGEFS